MKAKLKKKTAFLLAVVIMFTTAFILPDFAYKSYADETGETEETTTEVIMSEQGSCEGATDGEEDELMVDVSNLIDEPETPEEAPEVTENNEEKSIGNTSENKLFLVKNQTGRKIISFDIILSGQISTSNMLSEDFEANEERNLYFNFSSDIDYDLVIKFADGTEHTLVSLDLSDMASNPDNKVSLMFSADDNKPYLNYASKNTLGDEKKASDEVNSDVDVENDNDTDADTSTDTDADADNTDGITVNENSDNTNVTDENGCSSINVNGELTDWKYIISFFWTLRNNYSKHEQYDNLLSGDDYADMKEIFNEFNVVEYEIEDMGEEKVLKVNITNKTLEEMEKYWLFSSDQKAYLENLIAADELWDGILGMNGMATLAYSELGQTGERYYDTLSLSDGDEWSIAFVYYLLNECGYVGDNYVRKTTSIEAFRLYCNNKGWMTLKPVIGDIAFLSINGEDRVGIISNIEDNYIYIILGNYDRASIVKEIYVSKTSGILTGAFVHISLPDAVMSLKQNSFMLVGNGECLWPVPGNYYVTSTFGPRWGTVHQGMDISCPEGTPVVAAKSGTVSLSYRSNSAGEYIVIDHGDGMCTEYMHNSLRLVSVGDYVEAGQVIAYSGNTGQSTGPHCHFGVRINGTRVDPAPYLGIPLKLGDVSEYVTGE